ncbi:hypothetical protein PORY_002320 [Pneumocystis oryctolagi]|uniref:Uncharacterized protein n=1 Tax=Pneumocystis oryctolagi TaxID=42067 RepID=A0ACB7CBD1_9ASCO|nr:hypothetical protein PORY_002320 [Pneumocystis oryctolagi]
MQLQPGWAGVFVTCTRTHERQATREILSLFSEFLEKYVKDDEENRILDSFSVKNSPICWEERIAQEVTELREKNSRKLQVIDTKTPCVIFIRTKWPIDPVEIVRDLCEKIQLNQVKRIRWCQRLTPVTLTACATLPDLQKLAQKVLKPHFHKGCSESLKERFAIHPNLRNHTKMIRDDIIKTVASVVGSQHKVDLKNYDFLIIVEVFKGICGMSVIRDFEKYKKLNIASIMESTIKKI